jgi:putative polyketide hydroxylase
MREVPVLIVGGGPVGLTASILLAREGIASLLVERHAGTAIHPKARAINARSMEMYRQLGIEADIRAAGLAPEKARFIVWTRTLAGEEIERRVPWRASAKSAEVSPVRNCRTRRASRRRSSTAPARRRCGPHTSSRRTAPKAAAAVRSASP